MLPTPSNPLQPTGSMTGHRHPSETIWWQRRGRDTTVVSVITDPLPAAEILAERFGWTCPLAMHWQVRARWAGSGGWRRPMGRMR